MFRSLLVPLDGSTFAEHALPLALTIARRSGAAIQLVHVYVPPILAHPEALGYYDPALEWELKKQHKAYLDQMVQRLQGLSSVQVSGTLLEGEVAETLRTTASATGADLVVMTTHGRGPMQRFWLGSVADTLVRELPVPLLLLRPEQGPVDLSHERVPQHFLLPLDGSALAEQMLKPAVALGTLMGANYTLLRVVKPVHPVFFEPKGQTLEERAQSVQAQIDAAQEKQRKDASDYLERVASPLRADAARVETRVVIDPHPASAIIQEAARSGINLVALETHGRGGLARLVRGSVADKVLRGVTIPLLVARPVFP
jgi:nucleotide-binding universal stress UspA family protein